MAIAGHWAKQRYGPIRSAPRTPQLYSTTVSVLSAFADNDNRRGRHIDKSRLLKNLHRARYSQDPITRLSPLFASRYRGVGTLSPSALHVALPRDWS